jgi:uncharacterized protein (TIGR00296 family)
MADILSVEEIDNSLMAMLVKLARKSIELYMEYEDDVPIDYRELLKIDPRMGKRAAVFVTLEKVSGSSRALRGCIGFTAHHLELARAVVESAIASAFKDPRFEPLSKEELDSISIEIAVLGPKIEISGPRDITIGRDALYIESIYGSGILLPQVPIEYCWDEETFLGETCLKAGLDIACWMRKEVKKYRIPGRVFYERSPGGEVVERNLIEEYRSKCF